MITCPFAMLELFELFNISHMFLFSGVEGSACLTDVVPWAVRPTNLIYDISLVFGGGVVGPLAKKTFFPRYARVLT
jgi:hypothetical protein